MENCVASITKCRWPARRLNPQCCWRGCLRRAKTSVTEPARTRDHTELALEEFGAPIERHGRTIRIPANGEIKWSGRKIEVPGDLSSAVFFIAAASMFPESSLHLQGVGLNPTRTAILDVFARMGASLQMLSLRSAHGEIIGDIAVKGAVLKGGVIEGAEIPLVIDELPMLAALGSFYRRGHRDSRCVRIARKGERSHRCAGGEFAAHGRHGGRAAGRIESGRPKRGKIARRGNRATR